MNLQEQLAAMKGTAEERFYLLNSFIDRMVSGEVLLDHEIAMLEYLKTWAKENAIKVDLSATVSGVGGM